MTGTMMALVALRAAVMLGVAVVAVRLLRRSSAATRRSVLVGAFVIVVVLPIASAVLPALHLRAAEARPAQTTVVVTAPDEIDAAAGVAAPALPRSLAREAPHSAAPSTAGTLPSSLTLALLVWALGAAAVLARLGVGVVRVRRLVASARFVETLDVRGRPVQVRVSSAIETPAVTGLLVPVVLLPREAETWSSERRRLVLAHELAHVTSRDCLANVVAQLAVAMHWFDPLAWIAARRLRLERELAADDRVLDDGDVLASSYAEHLLALASNRRERPMPTAALAMAEPAQLSVRVQALLTPRPRQAGGRNRHLTRVGLAAGIAIAAVVACATPERDIAPAPQVDTTTTPSQAAAATATIDPNIQAIADEEIERMTKEWAPCAAIVLVVDPHTGYVVGAAYRGGTESTAQLAAARSMVAGSTIKPLVIAAALDEGVITKSDRFDASPQPHAAIQDATPHGTLDVAQILAVSSNVGLAKIFDRLGGSKLALWTKRFHLSAVPSRIDDDETGTAIAIGNVRSTPLEVTAAFATLANGGVYHPPTFVERRDDGERVVRAETASTVLALLEPVTSPGGTGKAARVDGVRVAGKTGTAHLGQGVDTSDYYSSFVGTAPLDAPRYVVFVGAETPRDGGTGGQVAAPVFGRVMTRLLAR